MSAHTPSNCRCCGAEPNEDHVRGCSWLAAIRTQEYPRLIDQNGREWSDNRINALTAERDALKAECENLMAQRNKFWGLNIEENQTLHELKAANAELQAEINALKEHDPNGDYSSGRVPAISLRMLDDLYGQIDTLEAANAELVDWINTQINAVKKPFEGWPSEVCNGYLTALNHTLERIQKHEGKQ